MDEREWLACDNAGKMWESTRHFASERKRHLYAVAFFENRFPETEESEAVLLTVVRDIFGNPFRPVMLDPALRTPTVLALAQAAYDNGLPDRDHLDLHCLTVLADALEEAGCGNAELLSHLRDPGPHVRGCWVVDLLLCKE